MLIVDLIAGAVIAGMAAWGVRAGVSGMLVFACFAVGAVAGAVLAPRALADGQDSSFALAVAFPAALLAGGLVAAVLERRVARLGRRVDRLGAPGAIGGAVLGAWVAVVALWLTGAGAAQIGELRDRVEDSMIIGGTETVLSRIGPRDRPQNRRVDLFPILAGPGPPIGAPDHAVVRDPDVQAADRSVVRIAVAGCGRLGFGSGWVAAPELVVTNAHVVAATGSVRARLRGRGSQRPARVVWFDRVNDVALLRVPAFKGVPALPIVRAPVRGVPGAALGFPGGVHSIRAARLGPTTDSIGGRMSRLPLRFPRELAGRTITTFRARTGPGSSGGPVVDARGRVLTTIFGGRSTRQSGMGVPNRFVRRALRRAGPVVRTGPCRLDR